MNFSSATISTARRSILVALLLCSLGALLPLSAGASTPLGQRATSAPLTLARAAASSSQPFGPTQLRSAYGLPARGAGRQTVAIISAYDDPYLQSDLAAYDTHFRLPACTVADGCLRKVNDSGQTSPLPPKDLTGGMWITESAVGSELVHGLCQSCHVLLVEASSDEEGPFSKAVATAAKAGATVIVTTFAPPETLDENVLSSDYTDPRAAVVAAVGDPLAGDFGYTGNLNFPASLPSVLAVGGSHLNLTSSGAYGSESAWDGTVTGCSSYESAPLWQTRFAQAAGCGTHRVDADLSAVADPGVIVHITGAGQSGGPWYTADGTSVSAPVIGAVIGLAGSVGSGEAQMLYGRQQSDPGAFHDVRTGANAPGCRNVICRGASGWDGPTGLGTPAGLEAFLPGGPVLSASHPHLAVVASHSQASVSRSWGVALALDNANPFRVSGTLVLSRTLTVGGHRRSVTFARTSFHRNSLDAGAARLTIASAARSVLRGGHRVTVNVSITGKGASGRAVSVRQQLTLVGPR